MDLRLPVSCSIKSLLSTAGIALLLLFGGECFAAPAVSLVVTYDPQSRKATFLITPSESAEGCKYRLYGASKRRALLRTKLKKRILVSVSADEGATRLMAQKLNALKRRKRKKSSRAYFVVEAVCSGAGSSRSEVQQVEVPRNKRGYKTVGRWLSGVARRVKFAELELAFAFPGLLFSSPVDLQHPGDGSGRLFVVEQGGTIRVFENRSDAQSTTLFLDINGLVATGAEQGLLGLTFHPQYKVNGYFFINYTEVGTGDTVIVRFTVSSEDPNKADAGSAVEILRVAQPYRNHNAGQLAFGPDGYLYIGLGDGGDGGDPHGHGQNPATLLGSLLRIDVDRPADGKQYGIPGDNPFVGNTLSWREEAYAYGFRNPWRFSFDPENGDLWLADVGQNKREEVNLVEAGLNYGWNVMEGTLCYSPASGCDMTGLEIPIVDYPHSQGLAVTGGYVYRGSSLPNLVGAYIYGDYGSGRIWTLRKIADNSYENALLLRADSDIVSFGVDENGELYVLSLSEGIIYRFSDTF